MTSWAWPGVELAPPSLLIIHDLSATRKTSFYCAHCDREVSKFLKLPFYHHKRSNCIRFSIAVALHICLLLYIIYRIAGNFRGVKYSLVSWAGRPPRNFIVGVANVGMPCSHETKQNFYSRKLPFLELNEFFTPRNLPAIQYITCCRYRL